MAPRYAPSLRGRLPWLILILETIFISIFLFSISFEPAEASKVYPAFQDINVMIFLGFGFLLTFMRRFGFSGVGFNLLIAAFGIQWAIILDGVLFHFKEGSVTINMPSLLIGSMSTVPALISAGALLGKVNPVQLIWVTLVEVTLFTVNRWIISDLFMIEKHASLMFVHIFGAYFGLAIAWFFYHPLLGKNTEKERSQPTSHLFSLLGSLFLWMFWPTFNSVLVPNASKRRNAVYNTYYALAVSAVTAFSFSVCTNARGKLNMVHIRNAVLAGGVAVGFSAYFIYSAWIAMTIGFLAGMISALGFTYIQAYLNSAIQIHDTCGVHATFGLPGLLGGVAYVVLTSVDNWDNLTRLGYQAVIGISCILVTLIMSLVGGLLTGLFLTCKLWNAPQHWKYFDDQAYWEFPHLANKL
uniref:Blood group Rh(CE) polypeptide isoform X2 n=1 Tax=Geotrypetes seraphini TaxID=260995 RepID=A0A6P8RW90_GEOSA|nr:blood group Rh(CE) polypeptide isoform X2 [Geotrypetes seraphini]